MNTIEMIEVLGSKYRVVIDKVIDGSNYWSVGLDLLSGDEYVYACEGETLTEAIRMAYEYHRDIISA